LVLRSDTGMVDVADTEQAAVAVWLGIEHLLADAPLPRVQRA
jgi:hypothetical protein